MNRFWYIQEKNHPQFTSHNKSTDNATAKRTIVSEFLNVKTCDFIPRFHPQFTYCLFVYRASCDVNFIHPMFQVFLTHKDIYGYLYCGTAKKTR